VFPKIGDAVGDEGEAGRIFAWGWCAALIAAATERGGHYEDGCGRNDLPVHAVFPMRPTIRFLNDSKSMGALETPRP
jgi:hypothetical protein